MKQKILVILPNNLGDVIMAAPVLEGLKAQDPAPHITFFAEDGYEGGIAGNPFCDAIFKFKRDAIRDSARSADWPTALTKLQHVIDELKAEKFDRVINLSQHTYVSYVVSLLSCPSTVGSSYLRAGNQAVRDTWSQYLYAIPFARRYNNLHATDIYRRIAGTETKNAPALMTVTEGERTRAIEKITARGWDPHGKPVIVFQPGAAFAAKRWPLEHFAALGRRLMHDGYSIIVTGAPQEIAIATGLTGQLGDGSFTTAGLLSFRETIALMSFADGCVTGDTAIMHAAAALGRKVYALFGPTNPVETGPYSKDNVVFCGRCARRPCFCFDCKTRLCMKSILPDDVFSFIKKNSAAGDTSCDIYTTAFNADGTFSLNPVVEAGMPFYNKSGAMITRRLAEPEASPSAPISSEDCKLLLHETGTFLKILDEMSRSLASFLETQDKKAIHRFEEHREKLAGFSEIGAFWTALLNLRLNSVPMLDPIAAVGEYTEICKQTGNEVNRAVAALL